MVELRVPAAVRHRAVQVLRGIGGDNPAAGEPGGRVVLPAPDGAATLTKALRRLEAAGISPDDAALRKPTLDDVFLALTARGATTAGNGNGRDQHAALPMEAVR